MNEALEKIRKRFEEIEERLADPGVTRDIALLQSLTKERSELEKIVTLARELDRLDHQLAGLEEILAGSDSELKDMARTERESLIVRRSELEKTIKGALRPTDPRDSKDVIVEIRAGTGGEEAALFVADLYRMYSRYAQTKGWRAETMSSSPTGLGGFKEIVFSVSGPKVWSSLKFERGAHRVQRVPETEASGRIHTSAVTVAVLPEADEVDLNIDPKDLRIDTYRSGGAGGQHVNKTESAVRVTHIPTGVVAACQDERSQFKNKLKAMKHLRAKLLSAAQEAHTATQSRDRKLQVGSGDRSEKIRTYNFPQDRITDHRIGLSLHNMPKILEGGLDPLILALQEAEEKEAFHG